MAHKIYDNFYLSNEVEDQFNSHLDLQQFCTVDNSLVGTAGMKRKINVYKATAGTEKLKMGEGNTKSIEVSFTPEEYEIQLAQNKFQYYDEQEMTDPMLVPVGTRHMGTDMFNTVNGDVYGEFKKATMVVPTAKIDFAAFVDAVANLNIESTDNQPEKVAPQTFAFVHPGDTAELRKNLAEDLKYVEAFARAGYIGTVGGVNIYTKKDATKGTIVVATRQAVTIFNKKGVEVETDRNGDIRQNTIWSRKYYLAALTDATKAVKIFKGTATATADTTVSEGKVYYEELSPDEKVRYEKLMEKNTAFAEWFIADERKVIVDCLRNITEEVYVANSIYPTYREELIERRVHQDRAVGQCYRLTQELQYAIETLPVDVNKYLRFAEMIQTEINLLKGWRKSDNKFKSALQEGNL